MFENVTKTAHRGYVHTQLQSAKFFAFLEEQLGDYHYDVDLRTHTVRFSSAKGMVEGDAFLVASVSIDPPTVMWSHADQLRDKGGEDMPELLLEFADVTDFAEFATPEVEYCDVPSVDEAVAAGFTIENTLVFMVGPGYIPYTIETTESGHRAVLILDFDEVPEVEVTDLLVYGPRVLTIAENHEQLFYILDGLCDIHEWEIADDGETISVSDGTQTVSITGDFSDPAERRFNVRHS